MRKFHLTFSFIVLSIVTSAIALGADSALLWLTSADLSVQIIRFVTIAFIGAQLMTTPPRPTVLRAATLTIALVAGAASLYSFTAMGSPFLDVLLFGHAAIALAVSALELKTTHFIEKEVAA